MAVEIPVAVIFALQIPPSFRGLSQKEVRRKLMHPENLPNMVDEMAKAIVLYFNKPVDYKELITRLATQIPESGGTAG